MSARSDAPGQCPFLSVSVRVSGHFERSSEIQDFEKRRAAAARQAAYRRRRRLGLIMVAFEEEAKRKAFKRASEALLAAEPKLIEKWGPWVCLS